MKYFCIKDFSSDGKTILKGDMVKVKIDIFIIDIFYYDRIRKRIGLLNMFSFNVQFEENYIPLSEWRETQINSILHD